jgi:hypothetical protein
MIDSAMWSNENFAALPGMARLLQIGIINHADDQGRIKGHPVYLRSVIFPYDDITVEDIGKWLDMMAANGTVLWYEANGKEYLQLLNWWDYQDITSPKPSIYPAPPNWQDKSGYVYLVHDGALYKIGISVQPDKRIQQLKYENGRPCTILVLIETENYRALEGQLHERFSNKRVKGEWFDLAAEDVAWIKSLAETEG